MIKKILSLAFISVFFIMNFSQIVEGSSYVPKYFSSSPNVASLGTYGGVPVNMSTGQPNINIDLFENEDIPISLSYNLSSIKPDYPISWTGLGWGLNIGGAVSRIVKGGVDEVYVDYSDPDAFSYYYKYNTLNSTNWFSDSKMTYYFKGLTPLFPEYFLAYPAPDEFTFSVNGINGSFFKNHEGKWIIKSNQEIDFKVTDEIKYDFTFHENGGLQNEIDWQMKRIIYGFEITDDKGVKYTFGKNPNALEISANGKVKDVYNSNFFVKSWYLTRVDYPEGNFTTLEYDNDEMATYIQHSSAYYSTYKTMSSMVTQSNTGGNFNLLTLERNFLKYLKKIKTRDKEIILYKSNSQGLDYNTVNSPWGQYIADPINENNNYGDYTHHYPNFYNNRKHWYKLDSILIKNNYTKIKKIGFIYDENSSKRLKLKKVLINDGQDLFSREYNFEYNSHSLPSFNAQKTDHWGFYNNKNFESSIASDPASFTYSKSQLLLYPNYREPDFNFSNAEVLTKIIYPTKGFSEFIYEPHYYSKYLNKDVNGFTINNSTGNTIAGGLRVQQIKTNDGTATYTKKYHYVNDYQNNGTISSGVLSGIPNYFDEGKINEGNLEYWKISSSSFIPLNDTNGSHITYSSVYEENTNGTLSEYIFSNHDNGYIDRKSNNYQLVMGNIGYVNTFEPSNLSIVKNAVDKLNFNSLEIERGRPLYERLYNKNKELVRETKYNYRVDEARLTDNIRSIDYLADVYGAPVDMSMYDLIAHMHIVSKMSAYTIYSHHSRLESKLIKEYFDTGLLETLENYSYNGINHHQITSQSINTSDGTILNKNISYAHEKGNQKMIDANMVGVPLETVTLKNGKALSKVETIYPTNLPTTQTGNLLLPLSVQSTRTNTISLSVPTIGEVKDTEITYDKYDDKGNILQYTTKSGIPVTIIWGYNQTQPIAKIDGATLSQVMTALNISDVALADIVVKSNADIDKASEDLLITSLDSFRNNTLLNNYQITTYTYDPLIGITSITPSNGVREIYKYDSANRLQSVVDVNGNILKEYNYNFQSPYFNLLKTQTFTRNNCGTGYTGGTYIYTVPAGKYSSMVSQADVDNQAQAEIDSNGQNVANVSGSCTAQFNSCIIAPPLDSMCSVTSSFTETSTNHFNANVVITFNELIPTTLTIGTLGTSCRPNTTKTFSKTESGKVWTLSIYANGDVTIKRVPSKINPGESISFSFEYDR